MDAGGLAQMNSNNFSSANGLAMPSGGLASRRGGPVKPLSLSNATPASNVADGVPTPRTSRSHLLAGLRTAPKSSTATNFPAGANGAPSPTTQSFARNATANNAYAQAQNNSYNGPKTALPRYGQHQQQAQQAQLQAQQLQQQQLQQQQQQAQQAYMSQYTTEQVLAPPEIVIDDQEQMDPSLYAQLVATNMYLAQQQQRLQQQLLSVQAAAQQFSGLNLQGAQQQIQQQQLAMYQQQQQLQSLQQSMLGGMQQQQQQQQQVYTYYDPVTRQQGYYVDQGQNDQQVQLAQIYAALQQQQQQQQQQQAAPRVQVSPPPENHATPFRTTTPPKRYESPSEVTPLPPPSANAFRRGHKKVMSLALNANNQAALSPSQEPPKSAGPKTASFPLTPLSGGYGPGQGRAGEHPVRQPRGPPSIEELKAKPTAKHEGSKNFATRTRRSAVHNLVRAGRERRKGTGSSSGSMSPVSESAEEESSTPITDNESDSGRSGSGSLAGDVDCSFPSSRTSTNGSWGAIGSDRPSSRQRARKSVDSVSSADSGENSFASVFKNSAQRAGIEVTDGQRKAPMLVLTSAEKRKSGILA
ncbi:hypothetical protein CkaCkLH20_01649 [Colletotrichum karsti]|uniref:Uncharacterized protein n=1 Tax=Colletotrichum karsti TaxID=1095194 RepID=A0A9P6LQD9_9PEZI|nr:uncharacterized protein CkaCkLH20_01649 [Colletotrichum karsti]KAF9880607.1 hypothetical protein CkaCkLH20_01649 [Colletotrichum karsti]